MRNRSTSSRNSALACAIAVACLTGAAPARADDSIDARIARIEHALDNKGLFELARQVDALQADLRQLHGDLENQKFMLEQMAKSQREAYADVDRRLSAIEQGHAAAGQGATPGNTEPPLPTLSAPAGSSVAGKPAGQSMELDVEQQPAANGAAAAAPAGATSPASAAGAANPDTGLAATAGNPGAGGAPPDETTNGTAVAPAGQAVAANAPAPSIVPPVPATDSAESEAAYDQAFGLLKTGQYDQAIAAFNGYLQRYPGGQYADNAQYWIGEAYYVMRKFEPAIEQYQKLLHDYPTSQKQSHAMLKIAYCYYELGQMDQAVAVLNDLKKRFPGSAAARLADERLQRIRAQAASP